MPASQKPATRKTGATPKAPRQTKAALLRARLSEPGGVPLTALMEMTGWQAHTLRAALSGLRKEGLTLTRRRAGEETIYAIEPRDREATAEAAGPAIHDGDDEAADLNHAALPVERDA